MKRIIVLVVSLFMVSAPSVMAQDDFCVADFDYSGGVDAGDVGAFLDEYLQRTIYSNPCPPDGPAPVPKTGQTTTYATGDDGDLEKGVEKPAHKDRFTDNLDGTVTDNLTGLIWLKNANCFGLRTWNDALSDCNGLSAGWCGLTDGSNAGDWRLPNRFELESFLDLSNYEPALPSGHPFNGVQSANYWSSTPYAYDTSNAWYVDMSIGVVYYYDKSYGFYVWPVRGGQ